MVATGLRHNVEIWDVSNLKKIAELPAQTQSAFKAQFNHLNSFEIATASFDNKLRLWDLSSGARNYIVTGATDGSVRFWLWKPEDI